MERYSNTMNALDNLELYWDSLPQVEQQSVANIDYLITMCEKIIQTERNGWYASSIDVKKTAEGFTSEGNKGKGNKEESSKSSVSFEMANFV